MGVESKQLADIFNEVREVFTQHSSIVVTPIKGDPPDQYEVRYTVPGVYKDETGKIQQSSNHIVTITIPFGFPHFPPSCKPKTPIFHPDFDPAAICLGDFWEHDRSLSDLIVYIGKMITGEIYSKENTFNEDAAHWYRENAQNLPFAEIPVPDPRSKQPEPTSLSLFNDAENGIDTLEDSDFSSDFNYLGMELEGEKAKKPVEMSPVEPPPSGGEHDIDVETIWLLSRQKRFFQLKDILKDLPAAVHFEGKEELAERIETVFAEARQMYSQGESMEHQGLPGKALEKYIAVEELVSDYPKIHDDIRRTEQSKDLLGDWTQADGEKETAKESGKEKKGKKAQSQGAQGKKADKSGELTFYTEKSKRQFNLVPLVVIGCILFIVAPLVYFYTSQARQYTHAEQLLAKCTEQMNAKQFESASKSCNSALALSKDILFFKQEDRKSLNEKIDLILTSEEMRQGLAGFVMMDGKYVLQATADMLKLSKDIVAQGDKLMSESKWQSAMDIYTKGLDSIQKDGNANITYRSDLEKKLHLAKTRLLMQAGTEAMSQKSWQQARQKFQEALVESKTLDGDTQKLLAAEIKPQLDKCTFLLLKQKGDELFAGSDWTGAFSHFQDALALGAKLEQSETQVLSSLQGDIIRADLYATINQGRDAFEKGQWDEAIKKYAKASKILMDNQGLLDPSVLEQNREKLTRIMLQASIIRDRQEAERLVEEENWSGAEKNLRLIINAINKSPAGKEKEFQTILQQTHKKITEFKDKQYIADKIKYLEDNYQTLFSENYPAAAPDTLSAPVITYIKQEGDKLLFKLQCTETGRGRPLKLVMFYSYSEQTKNWAFHSTTE
jgi:ubiquitin-protein ligase